MRSKRRLAGIILLLIIVIIAKIASDSRYTERYAVSDIKEDHAVYYLLNIDGMKGLGHSALLLVDQQGNGLFYSYNGMQYSLAECLMGKAGIGKMKTFELNAKEAEEFLITGDLKVSDTSECDNFDRALYRYLSKEEYETIKKELDDYILTEDRFEELYSAAYHLEGEEKQQAEAALQEFLSNEAVPKYQIYRHNCDTAAREAIAAVDEEMEKYNTDRKRLTPSANYKNMWKYLSDRWGFISMGRDSIAEKILWHAVF